MVHLASSISKAQEAISGPIARSAIAGLAMRLTGMALLFAQAVLAARLLGAEQYGIVAILLAIAHIAAAIVVFGFGALAVAEIPKRLEQGGTRIVQAYLRHSLSRVALLSTIVLPIAAVSIVVIVEDVALIVMALAIMTIPILGILQLFRGVAVGTKRPLLGQAPGEIVRPTLFLAALVGAFVLRDVNALTFMTYYLGTAALALLAGLPSIWPRRGQFEGEEVSANTAKLGPLWDRAALPFLGMHLAAILQAELATILLGIFASSEAAGLFQPIARIIVVLLLPTYALNLRYNPQIAELHSKGKRDDIVRLSRKYTWAASLVVTATGVLLALASPWLLMLFGTEFVAGAPLIWIIVAGQIALNAFGPVAILLLMTGHSAHALLNSAIGLALEAILAAILIPLYGILGAAWL